MTRRPAPPTRVLRDASLDDRLRTDGFVTTTFLGPDEVRSLVTAYDDLAPADDSGLVIDFMRDRRDVLLEVERLLAPIWERHLDELFIDHRVVVATFVTKHPGPDSAMPLHDEPSFVDERSARSHAVWIPLVDVGPELGNGHLLVLPGSEHLERGLAGYNTPIQYRPYEATILARMVPITARAGEAVVYDSRTLHASAPNGTATPRPAIAASVAPRGVPLVHVVATGRRHRRIHAVPDDFYLRNHPFELDLPALPYPLADEVDEHAVIDTDHLAGLLGIDPADLPAPRLDVPDDLRALVGTDEPRRVPRAAGTSPAALPTMPDLRLPIDRVDAVGATAPIGRVPVVLRGGSHAALVMTTASDEPALPPHARGATSVLAVDESGRARLRFTDGATHVVAAVECPLTDVGIAWTGHASALALGDRVLVEPHRDVVVWNNGVGQLVLAIDPPPPSSDGSDVG